MSRRARLASAVPDPVRALAISLVLGVGGYVAGLAAVLLVTLQLGALGVQHDAASELGSSVALNVVGLAGVGIVYLVLRRGGLDTAFFRRFLRVRRPSWVDAAVFVVGVVGAFALVLAYTEAVEFVDPFGTGGQGTTHSGIEENREEPLLFLVGVPIALLLTGPGEELLYRGVIQSRLAESVPAVLAIALTGLVFGVIHVPAYWGDGNLGEMAISLGTVTLLGMYFGVAYELTDNLLVPALLHGSFNAVVYAMNFLEYA